ncbi:MAG: aldo/keto reductase [Clostridia bacterium]|nr:aldo/keto reductase [Clostridia bacterium]
MKYRELGKTGLSVSEIGLGCEGFLGKDEAFTQDVLSLALENGVNCMDLYSPDPDMHKRVGRAIAGKRKDFILQAHLCTVWQDGQYKATRDPKEVRASFERMLHNLGTDYVDVGMIHYVDSAATWKQIEEGEIMRYALELKAAGKIGYIGMSSHNPVVALEAVKSGAVEVLMFSVNPCYDLLPGDEDVDKLFDEKSYEKPLFNLDPVREELYETCQRLGVGITVMKVFGGGDLLADYSPAGKSMTVPQCIHYALTRPAAASVMVGCRTKEELAASLAYESASAEERDYAPVFAGFSKMSWAGHCMYCGHCAPCPKGIEVANVTKFLNLVKAQGFVPETVREHYAALSAKAGDCVGCGACEKRCPFGVRVVENMRTAKETFGA